MRRTSHRSIRRPSAACDDTETDTLRVCTTAPRAEPSWHRSHPHASPERTLATVPRTPPAGGQPRASSRACVCRLAASSSHTTGDDGIADPPHRWHRRPRPTRHTAALRARSPAGGQGHPMGNACMTTLRCRSPRAVACEGSEHARRPPPLPASQVDDSPMVNCSSPSTDSSMIGKRRTQFK